MLKAYSVFNDLNKDAIQIIRNAGVDLEISKSFQRPNKQELVKLLNSYDILIISVKEKFTKDMLDGLNTRKIIATLSIGLDHIDEEFFSSDMIEIVNCPTANVISVSEHIFSLILGLKKRIIEANDISLKGGTKADLSRKNNDINNSILGVIGAGKISREVIKISKVFNMKVYCNTLNPEKHIDLLKQNVEFMDLNSVLSKSDIISVNIPLTNKSENLISNDRIKLMKKTATFINTSRAEIADVEELVRYAEENEEFSVGLDIDVENYKKVLSKKRNNVIVTPHIAGTTKEAVERMDIELANNIVKCLDELN